MRVEQQLLVCAEVEEPARGVVGARGEGIAVWEKLEGKGTDADRAEG